MSESHATICALDLRQSHLGEIKQDNNNVTKTSTEMKTLFALSCHIDQLGTAEPRTLIFCYQFPLLLLFTIIAL